MNAKGEKKPKSQFRQSKLAVSAENYFPSPFHLLNLWPILNSPDAMKTTKSHDNNNKITRKIQQCFDHNFESCASKLGHRHLEWSKNPRLVQRKCFRVTHDTLLSLLLCQKHVDPGLRSVFRVGE